jgi:hypothetical protein
MNWKFTIPTVAIAAFTGFVTPITLQKADAQEKVQFLCSERFDKATRKTFPTTFASTSRGRISLIQWETKSFPGYSPQERCDEVSSRFQTAYDNKTLRFLTNGTVNNQPVICTTNQYLGRCNATNVLMTLRSGDNSFAILNSFRNILNGRQKGPVKHSAGAPQAYYEIDIENLIRTGTVEQP